ncbi:fimbrial protein [Antarcticirhabdus aurantiaca]|uniref:Fimbrial protein n=1 Tax=Antarcticirhabdus aurantiaca TaxID=2606717 RepID=A0ACD4NJU6_9HYPH|nr:fimbrial protein [Antarcticirhabdus aurantiaca]WAJ27056.1 fimbrial protein [Jeongeuplla avenae]
MAAVDDETEKPLDPALERVRRRMVRMLLVTMGVTFLGLMAVVAALVYRMADRSAPQPVAVSEAATVSLGPGRSVSDVALDGDGERALLRLAGPDGEELLLIDLASGTPIGRVRLVP